MTVLGSAAMTRSTKTHAHVAADGKPDVILYCDGACSPNPGIGGWGVILEAPKHGGRRRELSGAEPETTNNRMELTAAIEGFRAIKRPCRVRVVTDSQYLKNAFTAGWLQAWQANGWRTADKKPVKNKDLWQALTEAIAPCQAQWEWVRGHAAHPENERCDALAVQARQALAACLATG
jgi:ribonuclease HI